jgi:hypothetical protein
MTKIHITRHARRQCEDMAASSEKGFKDATEIYAFFRQLEGDNALALLSLTFIHYLGDDECGRVFLLKAKHKHGALFCVLTQREGEEWEVVVREIDLCTNFHL